VLAVSAWHLRRQPGTPGQPSMFHRSAALATVVLVPASVLILMVGSKLGVVETTYQPMKIAAAEAQWSTCQPCSFSLFQIGGGNNDHSPTQIIGVPHLLSLLATGSWNGKVVGLDPLQTQDAARYGPGQYVPNVFVQYWSMRVMAYAGTAVVLLALWAAYLLWRRRMGSSRLFLWAAAWAALLPFLMNTAGWMLTENGRQPWIVQGLQLTRDASSPSVGTAELVTSIVVFAVLYVALAVVDAALMLRFARTERAPTGPYDEEEVPGGDESPALHFSY